MIRLIAGNIIFKAYSGKQFLVPWEVVAEYVDYNKLDDMLSDQYLDAYDFDEYAEREPILWGLIQAWKEMDYDDDFNFEEMMEYEVNAEARVTALWKKGVAFI